ncbi:MAG: hypothetical protein WCS59_06810, partial [Sphaerochaetaceae bacterium]
QGEDEKMRERFVIVAEHVEFHPDPQWKEGSRDEEITLEDKVDGQEDNMVFETPTKTKPKKK